VQLADALMRPIEEWREVVKNDFESHIFEAHPSIAELKAAMYEAGALYASMSGSGSAVFGLFAEEPKLSVKSDNYLKIMKL
jgi:4-diphosphocytidyl-2-C-methyl-D-erythritol kinase